jgi:putative membrane protein
MLSRGLWATVALAALGCIVTVQAADLSSADRAFLKSAADANMTEAHLGKMAQDQAADTGVKDFGQTLVKDHTKAYGELTVVANKTGESIPKGIDVRRNRAIVELTRQKGMGFDRRFLAHEVQDHRKTITEFKREAEKGQNADVKAYAQKMIPTLEEHLRKAEELEKSGKRPTASADRQRR